MACHQNQILNYKINQFNFNIKSESYALKSQFQFYIIGDKLQKFAINFPEVRNKVCVIYNFHFGCFQPAPQIGTIRSFLMVVKELLADKTVHETSTNK